MSIDARLLALERELPREVVLLLDDGHTFHYPGPPLQFYAEANRQMYANGPLFRACCRAVRSSNGDRLYELIRAVGLTLQKAGKHDDGKRGGPASEGCRADGARSGRDRAKR